MSSKRGQSGVEYLTMYALALMIVMLVIAGVYYMMSTKPTTPQCTFSQDLQCADYSINSSGNLRLIVWQNTGHQIIITTFNCTTSDNPAGIVSPITPPVTLNSGAQQLVINGTQCYLMSGSPAIGTVGNYYAGKLFLQYNETDTGFVHILTGNIVVKYE